MPLFTNGDQTDSRQWFALLSVGALLLVATGCGESNKEDDAADNRGSAKTEERQSSERALSGKDDFKRCVNKAGAKLKPEPPTLKDRIAVGGAGNLPATYVGAVVWPNDAYMDVWLADDAESGAKTADLLNEAEARSEGVTEVEAAFNTGRAVSAPVNDPDTFGNLPLDQLDEIDACLKATNE
jgi:hypothetical protein